MAAFGSDLVDRFPNPETMAPDTPDGAWPSCCHVDAALASAERPPSILPVEPWAVQNGDFKLVEKTFSECSAPTDDPKVCPPFETIAGVELDDLCVSSIDYPPTEILHELREVFGTLTAQVGGTRGSEVACLGDGSLDKRVTALDLNGVDQFMDAGPSYFDFSKDNATNEADRTIVLVNLGTDCLGARCRADLNHDGRVTDEDAALLWRSRGPCNVELAADRHLCAADVDGNRTSNRADLDLLLDAQRQFKGQVCLIRVIGHNDPETDPTAVQSALDQVFVGPRSGQVECDF